MTSSASDKLIAHWQRHGLALNEGCDAQTVVAFEREHGVILPEAVRDYFRSVNGMKETFKDSVDPKGFSFWALHRLMPLEEIVQSAIPTKVTSTMFFLFADYFESSWTYACDFAAGSTGAVILVGRDVPETIAESFEEFVDLYIADAPQIYKGPSWR
jgi:cell wall assembly regulator SMI1